VANVDNAYCAVDDLLTGDIRFPARHGNGEGMIKSTAEEIDVRIGHLYTTPIVIGADPKYRPATLVLKKINAFLASGRLLMDFAAAEEDHETQAYARSLLKEANGLLDMIANGQIALNGAVKNVDEESKAGNKLIMHNEDSRSLVETFYRSGQGQYVGQAGFYGSESDDFPW
jgi:hypothetical protein